MYNAPCSHLLVGHYTKPNRSILEGPLRDRGAVHAASNELLLRPLVLHLIVYGRTVVSLDIAPT